MSFEYIVEKENKKVKLSEAQRNSLVSSIVSDYKTYNDARAENLNKAEKLKEAIFFKRKPKEKDKNKQWKTKVNMCKLFMYYQVLKAFIWKNTYSTTNSMFDVSGENQDADNDSNKQKAMLVNKLENMDFPAVADSVIDYSLIYGELIGFTTWRTKKEPYRRPISFFETLFKTDVKKLPLILEAKAKGKNFYIDYKTVFDDPVIVPVNPANFVFDTTQDENWDDCPKIYRSFKTPDDIINNKYYTIDRETAKKLKDLVKTQKDTAEQGNQSDERLESEVVNGSTVEVLDHWGDLKLEDGTVLKNWRAVVVAGKYLVQFSENESVINPFSFGGFIKDPDTQRYISILYSIYELSLMQEDLMNRTCNMQALSENPPILAPDDFFEDEEIELYPGKVITYDPQNYGANALIPMKFDVSVFLNDINSLSDLMSEVSGIFPNMWGADEKGDKTATELSIKAQGQSTRLQMIIDTINQYFVIPSVKNVAKLCANFKFGIEKLFINKDNKKETIEIDDNIRQAEYKYTYSDRNATVDRFNKADITVQAIKEFAQYVPMNTKEVFTWFMEQKGVDNPERFLLDNPQLPLEVQEIIMQDPQLMQVIQMKVAQKVQEMQQQGVQPENTQAENNITMQENPTV